MPPRKNTTKENKNDVMAAAVTSKTTKTGTCDPVVGMKLFDANNSNNNNGNPGSYYSIGPLLGKGEFGSVHCIHYHDGQNNSRTNDTGIETDWVVKLTPVPTKITKKQDTPTEVAYRLLWNEYLLYTQHFSEPCGTYLPVVPKFGSSSGTNNPVTAMSSTKRKHQGTTPIMKYDITTPYIDNHNGYRCLIMERMESDIFDALPQYIAAVTQSSSSLDVGAIAIQLFRIIEAIHDRQFILIDVKPENIMIRKGNVQNLAQSIRLVDLGLVKHYLGPDGHKVNEGIPEICGTPQYASLNVHNLQTPSRRDDIEAMLYVIGELVIRIQSIMLNTTSLYEPSSSTKSTSVPASYLPWSTAKSEKEVGQIKLEQVSKLDAEYYKRMPPPIAKVLYTCWTDIQSCKYQSKPKYEEFCQRFTGLAMPIVHPPKVTKQSSQKRSTDKKANAASKAGVQPSRPLVPVSKIETRTIHRMTRSSSRAPVLEVDSNDPSPKYRKLDHCVDSDDVSMMDIDKDEDMVADDESFQDAQSTGSDEFHDAQCADHIMLPEYIDNDTNNHKHNGVKLHQENTSIQRGQSGVKLLVKLPDESTVVYYLVKGGMDSMTFGSKASTSSISNQVCLPDPELKPSHARITYKSDRSVHVQDLSGGHTWAYNSMKIPKSGSDVFTGQDILLGKNVKIIVQQVSQQDYTQDVIRTAILNDKHNGVKLHQENTSIQRGQSGVKLLVKLPDESTVVYYLVKGGMDSITFGSKASTSSSSNQVCLPDPELIPSHARITYKSDRSVHVEDLSGGHTWAYNSMKIPKSGSVVFTGQDILVGKNVKIIVQQVSQQDYTQNVIRTAILNDENLQKELLLLDNTKQGTAVNEPVKLKKKITLVIDGYGDYIMEENGTSCYIIGSKPSGSKGQHIKLPSSTGVQPNHVKLELIITAAGVMMVNVTDLKSGSDTFVEQRIVPHGKSIMAFYGGMIKVGSVVIRIKK